MWRKYALLNGNCGSRGKTHDLESVSNDADSHGLLSVVAAVHHDRVGETLDDGALSLAETLGGIATSGVGGVDRLTDLNVVAVGVQKRLAIQILQIECDIDSSGEICPGARVFAPIFFLFLFDRNFHPLTQPHR